MALAITALLADPERREGMGRAGRERAVSAYGIERTLNALQVLYEQV